MIKSIAIIILVLVAFNIWAKDLNNTKVKYVPLIELYGDGVGETQEVSQEFISLTNEWRKFRKKIDTTIFTSAEIFDEGEIREEMYYLNDKLVLVDAFEKQDSGKYVLIQKQYYKNKTIYLLLANLDKQGRLDVMQYYSGTTVKYSEILPISNLTTKHTWREFTYQQ